MRVLVTGAAGAVGSYVRQTFSDCELVLSDVRGDFERLDVTDAPSVMQMVADLAPDVVLHLAAATDVDVCEQEPDLAFRANAIGTQNVALASRRAGATLVYISTAGVFGGDKVEPYTEFDEPGPANVYGHSKLAGERIVTALLDTHYIVRAGWMIGGGSLDRKFVGKIVDLIEGGAERLRAVDDKFGSPTYAKDLLLGIRRLLETGYFGLYHLVNDGSCSRYDVALAIRDVAGLTELDVEPVSSAYFPLPAPRARSEAMRNYKLELLGLEPMRPWRAALDEYLTQELLPARRAERAQPART
jgi:dTDP-4-dehydrorhamnose reductase